MTPDREPGTRRSGHAGEVDVWLLLILAMLGGLAALAWFTWEKVQAVHDLEKTGIEKAVKDRKMVIKSAGRIASLADSAKVFAGSEADTSNLISFFEEQQKAAGIKRESMKGCQALQRPPPKDGYVEVGFKLSLEKLTRRELATFLFHVEDKKPFVKSKVIDLGLDEAHNIKSAAVTLVYYERQK
jgi:hypothetical protein